MSCSRSYLRLHCCLTWLHVSSGADYISQCNGHHPCNTCIKRRLTCVYTPTPTNPELSPSPVTSPTKRRHVVASPAPVKSDGPQSRPRQASAHLLTMAAWNTADASALNPSNSDDPYTNAVEADPESSRNSMHPEAAPDYYSRLISTGGPADEAEAYSLQRMLQDSTGRLRTCRSI
jgi:hypothetical protein